MAIYRGPGGPGDATTDAATVAASRSVILAVPFLTPVNVHSAAFAAET